MFAPRSSAATKSPTCVPVVGRMRGVVDAPLVFDSTEYGVLEVALKLYGGKAIINSINFEDGEDPAARRLELARRYGAAVVALTIDEKGMAKTCDDKLALAHRLFEFACTRYGLAPSDLLFDPLTFTICTGNEDDRKLGLWTLEAIERIARELPECQIVLGLSNISFGLAPAARQVLNSVYLDHALQRGLSTAIVHFSKILPLHRIPEHEVKVAEDLIFDRRQPDYDPLHAYLALFDDRAAAPPAAARKPAGVEERLTQRIIDGDRLGLDADLDEALTKHPALDIINVHLLDWDEGGGRLVRRRQDAASVRAAIGGNHEGPRSPISSRTWTRWRAARRAPSCWPRSGATCTILARTWSTSSSPTTGTG